MRASTTSTSRRSTATPSGWSARSCPLCRDRLFVAGKTLRSNPEGVEAQFDDTRRLLGCDVLDLYQAHGVTDLEVLDARADAIDRIVALRDQGATRFAGITGHDLTAPATFIEALRRWDLDTVMFPVYPRLWADPVYRADAEALLATCVERDVGVMAIKAIARRPWADGRSLAASLDGDQATDARWADSWYEPVSGDAIARGVAFALSTPGVHAFCTPGDRGLLPEVLAAAAALPGPVGRRARRGRAARWPTSRSSSRSRGSGPLQDAALCSPRRGPRPPSLSEPGAAPPPPVV